ILEAENRVKTILCHWHKFFLCHVPIDTNVREQKSCLCMIPRPRMTRMCGGYPRFSLSMSEMNPHDDDPDSVYYCFGGRLHVKEASYVLGVVRAFGFSALLFRQSYIVYHLRNKSQFGAAIYLPVLATTLFLLLNFWAILTVLIALRSNNPAHLKYVMTYVIFSVFYFLISMVLTLMAFVTDFDGLEFMRVQLENTDGRDFPGVPTDKKTFKDGIAANTVIIFVMYLLGYVFDMKWHRIIEKLEKFLKEEAIRALRRRPVLYENFSPSSAIAGGAIGPCSPETSTAIADDPISTSHVELVPAT
uniref:Uncharacterized protein n=1 Tax=Romanomermis culicivorax TaxID=13658 RepID=A0A915L4G3_ROMCU